MSSTSTVNNLTDVKEWVNGVPVCKRSSLHAGVCAKTLMEKGKAIHPAFVASKEPGGYVHVHQGVHCGSVPLVDVWKCPQCGHSFVADDEHAQDFGMHTALRLLYTGDELKAIYELEKSQQMSTRGVLRQALATYEQKMRGDLVTLSKRDYDALTEAASKSDGDLESLKQQMEELMKANETLIAEALMFEWVFVETRWPEKEDGLPMSAFALPQVRWLCRGPLGALNTIEGAYDLRGEHLVAWQRLRSLPAVGMTMQEKDALQKEFHAFCETFSVPPTGKQWDKWLLLRESIKGAV